jgi:GNAT superfamily N-acetyltransferase
MGDVMPYPATLAAPLYLPPVPLTSAFDTTQFDCGKPALNDWLKRRALDAEGRSARSYVVATSGNVVVGYYCIANGAITRSGDLPRKLKHNMPDSIPVEILGRLAVDINHQGKGIGRGLMKDSLSRIIELSRIGGCCAVVVHAIDSTALPFYLRYGFRPLLGQDDCTLFLPIEEAITALK